MTFTATFTRLRGRRLPPKPPNDSASTDRQDNDADGAVDEFDQDCFRSRGRGEG